MSNGRNRRLQLERKQKQEARPANAEDELRVSETRYRRLFEAAKDGILILDAKTTLITDVNPFLIELLHYPREYFIGKALWEIGAFKDVEASKAAFRELEINKYVQYDDLPLNTQDGRSVSVEFVSNVYSENDKTVIQCNIRDISARKRAERADRGLLQAQKLEAVGQLAGGVAHDFNNLLGVMLGYCALLQENLDLSEANRNMVCEIEKAGKSAATLTRQLLAFSRRQVFQLVVLDLNIAVSEIHEMLNRLIGEDIEVIAVLCPTLGNVNGDPTQIEQVVMNLALNARDAMPQGGKITIETTNVYLDEAYARQHLSAGAGSYVMLAVSDTGTGMDQETQSHIFEPFFTTKGLKGTGLGLSTVYGIVKQSAGHISVHSEVGHGTTFKVYLPRVQAAVASVKQETVAPVAGGSETILLVEDAPALRQLTRVIMEQSGYTVLDSGDPAEAIRIAEQHKGPLPLLITDLVMPVMNGRILAETLIAARPGIAVLYTSGYTDNSIAPHDIESGCMFLEKPYSVKGGGKLDQQGGAKLDQRKWWKQGVLREGMASGAEACAA